MKKYLVILAIAIISILPITSASALTIDGKEYDLPDLPSYVETYPYYTIANDMNNDTYLIIFKNTRIINDIPNSIIKIFYSLSLGGGSVSLSGKSYNTDIYYYKLENDEWVYKNYGAYGAVSYSLSNDIGITTEDWQSNPTIVKPFLQEKIIYTNVNYFVCSSNINNCSLFFSNADLKKEEYLSYSYDKIETENNIYYNFLFSIDTYKENYQYRIKLNNGAWHYMNSQYFTYQILYNGTIYMEVLNENSETVESKTFTISDLMSKEDFYTPTIDINVGCSTDLYTDIEQAKINLTFNNYSTNYTYQYSFDDINYISINYTDIINKKYTITSHVNGPIFVKILDSENNIVYKNSARIDCILDSENYYYYELTIDDLYNYENNELIYYTFLYENKKRDITPFVYFYYTGSDSLNFHITYDTEVTNFDIHYNNLANNTLKDISCTTLPFEYIDDNIFSNNYTTYTMFSFMPCIDLSTFLYGEQYIDFKLIIKSNIELNIGEPITFGGAFLPTTNKPVDNSGYDSPFLDYFNNFVNEDFGLSAIVQAPLNFIKNLSNNTCTSLKLVMPIVNVEFELPCMSSVYSKYFGEWFTLYQTITTGVIAYWVCVKIFALVKDFHDPQNDKIEVMDL